ncbi:hypothetical protein NC651_029899 [Populus alba x Populus x berolinensis]|nr:hypothetical protein NC651_029899 [Populus alba x Populus x berolinensis]
MVASSGISFVLETGFVQCWSGSDVEWQWLLDEEDDELKMALAVLVRLSSFCPFFSSFFQSSSPAFIGQRWPCAGKW